MTEVADARRLVVRARRRLLAEAVADGFARGVVAGSLAGIAAMAGSAIAGEESVVSVAVGLAVVGATAGAIVGLRRAPSEETAALALDRAARTEEAFVSALTAVRARQDFRELAARYALDRCDLAKVRSAIPVRPPRLSALATVSAALLAALVLVPFASADAPGTIEPPGPAEMGPAPTGAAPSSRVAAVSPHERVRALRDALAQARTADADALRPIVRSDLAAVGDRELAELASLLAEAGSEAGARAKAALESGDRATAVEALRAALGGSVAGAPGEGVGSQPGTAPGSASSATRGPGSMGSWPLRYDRLVRRWREASRGTEGSGEGGPR